MQTNDKKLNAYSSFPYKKTKKKVVFLYLVENFEMCLP